MVNESERLLKAISELRFYKELVQSNLQFTPEGSSEKEVADLLLNIGDIIIAIQLKARNNSEQSDSYEKEISWLTHKCKVAKKQVKESINFIKSGQLPSFMNGRNKSVSISADAQVIPLVIFINDKIEGDYPRILKKHSEEGMDINCMSLDDFQEMCKALFTPIEIVEYLSWRLSFYKENENINVSMFYDEEEGSISIVRPMSSESLVYQYVAENYGITDSNIKTSLVMSFSDMLHKLPERIVFESEENSSYPLILFFSHFNRDEIQRYMERIQKALLKAQNGIYDIVGSLRNVKQKYVIVFVSTHDGYRFDMDYLDDLARKKGEYDILLQVYCYWENDEEFRIDYSLMDHSSRYL